jgi:hypothetical protein
MAKEVRRALEEMGYEYDHVGRQFVLPHPEYPHKAWMAVDESILELDDQKIVAATIHRCAGFAADRKAYRDMLKEREKHERTDAGL